MPPDMLAERDTPQYGADLPHGAPSTGEPLPSPVRQASLAGGVSLLDVIDVLRRQWLVLAACALLFGAVPVVIALARPRTFTAVTSFMPQVRSQTNISSLASSLGLSLPSADATQSPQFYADLARSREIIGSVAEDRFITSELPTARSLAEIYAIEARDSAIRRDAVIKRLLRGVNASVSQKTGVITLSVKEEDPVLASQIADRIVALLNQFNLEGRRSQAKAERQFTERRLAEATAELRNAENRLEAFLLANRNYTSSPTLRFEEERLSRAVATQNQVQQSLLQAFEHARLEEVRDTPVITVIEAPEVPPLPDRRGLVAKLLLGMVAGVTAGTVIAFLRESLAAARGAGRDQLAGNA